MEYEVRIAPAVRREVKRFDHSIRAEIFRRIEALRRDPRPYDSKKLEGHRNIYRVPVRNYRILYEIRDKELWVLVLKVGHRKEVYRGKV